MCCFGLEVVRVAKTTIMVIGQPSTNTQTVIYQNSVASNTPNAMILPVFNPSADSSKIVLHNRTPIAANIVMTRGTQMTC